ncbi:MAG: hypothetical protein Q4C34_07240 [Bacteroidales bacterium]|nr:hypothetical protein [Bacteroidales bacterium]
MKLEKFNLPAEVVSLLATLEPLHRGIIYGHLFALIYDGTPVPDDVEPRCRLIISLILRMLKTDIVRARGARARRSYRPAADTAADRNHKFWHDEPPRGNANTGLPAETHQRIARISERYATARKPRVRPHIRICNRPGLLPCERQAAADHAPTVRPHAADSHRQLISEKSRGICV